MKATHKFSRLTAICSFLLLFTLPVHAQLPQPGPEQKKLESHAGVWTYEGEAQETPMGPGGKFSGTGTAKMILDGFFLEADWEDKGTYNGTEVSIKGKDLLWYDKGSGKYRLHSFENDGSVTPSTIAVEGEEWISTGTRRDSTGKVFQVRTRTKFAPGFNSRTTKAELSADDGKTWLPWWQLTARKK